MAEAEQFLGIVARSNILSESGVEWRVEWRVKCTYQLPAARENPALNQGNGASMGEKRLSLITLEGDAKSHWAQEKFTYPAPLFVHLPVTRMPLCSASA